MPNIRHSIRISAKPETIYPLIATAEGLGRWWATDITQPGQTKAGTLVRFAHGGWRAETPNSFHATLRGAN
jgi:uncharacterized protein YndB with AHSA1/START domain